MTNDASIYENANSIAFQGALGAFSHLACTQFAPNFLPVPCNSFFDAFDAVSKGNASIALIPIENLIAGRVADVHQLLPEVDLHAVGEHYQPVRFELLGIPGTRLENIRTITSHVHALAQCRKLIRKLGAQTYVSVDTAESAKALAEDGDIHRGVLASTLAGEMYKLEILQADVADDPRNFTRFVAFSKNKNAITNNAAHDLFVTSIIAQTKNIPSALYRLLGVFAVNGINVTRLESCLSGDQLECSSFQIDFETLDDSVDKLLDECRHYTDFIKVLGTYPADKFRSDRSRVRAQTA